MTICKFLHFFNPSLFPIYDDWAIHRKVLTTFKNDWQGFRAPVGDTDIEIAYKYVLWASAVVRSADTSLMPTFVDWFAERIKPKGLPPGIQRNYGLAFEVVALGAHAAEGRAV